MAFDNENISLSQQTRINKPSSSVQLFINVIFHIRKTLNSRRATRLNKRDILDIKSKYWSNLLSASDKARLESIFLKFSKRAKS